MPTYGGYNPPPVQQQPHQQYPRQRHLAALASRGLLQPAVSLVSGTRSRTCKMAIGCSTSSAAMRSVVSRSPSYRASASPCNRHRRSTLNRVLTVLLWRRRSHRRNHSSRSSSSSPTWHKGAPRHSPRPRSCSRRPNPTGVEMSAIDQADIVQRAEPFA
jgi:hypothetical protein